ncbi:P-loop containing nucleoside triphosphate hydrolase protein [Lentinula aciculospora]|uniref:P-loop containing nucleoside triphosphate hydrolase protein n=1 Tax=Lentinula aciculospora TaxID=153920 RepID=A0A9W8ZY10_9AGAR|nr:P-loop containing nucleoside triphosphate hydrolase protein [Lentinula aciculospora]
MTHCPKSTPTFTGRENVLAELTDFFSEALLSEETERTEKIFLLYGLGGAGKTQTALEFVRRFKSRFMKIFFITTESENSIQVSYFDIALSNGIAAQNWEAGLDWLHIHEENWLIIIDNADDPKIPFSEYIPSCDHGNIIVTSRNAELQIIIDKCQELQSLTPIEGDQLLLKHAMRNSMTESQEEMAAKIAKELHYFPLA